MKKLIQFPNIENLKIKERIKVFESFFEFHAKDAPNFEYFSNLIKNVPERDRINISLQDEGENICFITLHNQIEYKNFIEQTDDNEIIQATVKIDKGILENRFSVYSFDTFAEDLLTLEIKKVMKSFSDLLKDASDFLIFDVFDSDIVFYTKTMFFVPWGKEIENAFKRKKRIEKCKEICYFFNFDILEILPDDFKVEVSESNNCLAPLFKKINAILSLGFIASSFSIENQRIKGIINGQRIVEFQYDMNSIKENQTLYTIYNWIYGEGNLIDKGIIARNIISIQCKYVSINEMDEKTTAAIQSNYNLYLKGNVKEYLELKNKICEFIKDTVTKTGEYATGLLDKFKSNIFAVFGFLFTVILANIVSEQPLNNIFTKDITILMELVIAGSWGYFIICVFQSNYETKKVYESYEQLKDVYKDILTEQDLSEIFDDKMIKKMKRSIKKSKIIYSILWIIFLLICLYFVEKISVDPFIKSLILNLKK